MRLALIVLVLAVQGIGVAQPCSPSGLTLVASGGRLGDGWSFSLAGPPGAGGYLGLDTGAGPAVSQVGPVCLDLSPALQLWPYTFDAQGAASWAGVLPASGTASGLELSLQAMAWSGAGVLLSEGRTKRLRSPAVLCRSSSPTGVACLDGNTGGIRWATVAQQGSVMKIVWLPALEVWVVATNLGEIGLFDPLSGQLVGAFVLTSPEVGVNLLTVCEAADGEDLIVVWAQIAGPGNTHVERLDVSTGQITSTTSLGQWHPLLYPKWAERDPASDVLWLRSGGEVRAVDTLAGAITMNLSFPTTFIAWEFAYGRLYLLGPQLAVIDRGTGAHVPGSPVAITGVQQPNQMLLGPGSAGDGLLVLAIGNGLTNVGGGFIEFDPLTLAVRQLQVTPWSPLSMVRDPGGLGWIVLERLNVPLGNAAQAVHWLDPATLTLSLISPVPTSTIRAMAPLPSDTLRVTWLKTTPTTMQVLDTSTSTPMLSGPLSVGGVDPFLFAADR